MKLHEFTSDSLHIEVSSSEGTTNVQLSKLCFPEIESYDESDWYYLYGEKLTQYKIFNSIAMDLPGTFRSKKDTVYKCTIYDGDSLIARLHNTVTVQTFSVDPDDNETPVDDLVVICPEFTEFGTCYIAGEINKLYRKNEKTRLETRPDYSEDYD